MSNLFSAIYEEHKQRTGHDIFRRSHTHCDVCLYINAERREMEETEKKYYENQRRQDEIESECTRVSIETLMGIMVKHIDFVDGQIVGKREAAHEIAAHINKDSGE